MINILVYFGLLKEEKNDDDDDKDFGLFRIPNSYLFLGLGPPRERGWRYGQRLLHQAHAAFRSSLRQFAAESRGLYQTREELDAFLREFIMMELSLPNDGLGCRAIVDFTRTSLPQLSGKQARDAFAMGYCLSVWETGCHIYLGSTNNSPLEYNGCAWQKPEDVGGLYYEKLRQEHPLVIYWDVPESSLGRIIHPDYESIAKKNTAP